MVQMAMMGDVFALACIRVPELEVLVPVQLRCISVLVVVNSLVVLQKLKLSVAQLGLFQAL